MNTDQIKGKAEQVTGKIKEAYGKLTNDDVALYNGKRDQLVGKLQEHYGIAKEEAERKIRNIEESCNCSTDSASKTAA